MILGVGGQVEDTFLEGERVDGEVKAIGELGMDHTVEVHLIRRMVD